MSFASARCMLQKWLLDVLNERAAILKRVAPVPDDNINPTLAAQDIYAAAAALLSWERHTGAKLEAEGHITALLAQIQGSGGKS